VQVAAWLDGSTAVESCTSAAIVCSFSLGYFPLVKHSPHLGRLESVHRRLMFLSFLDLVLPQSSQQDRLGGTGLGSGSMWLISLTQEASLLLYLSVIPVPTTCQNPMRYKDRATP